MMELMVVTHRNRWWRWRRAKRKRGRRWWRRGGVSRRARVEGWPRARVHREAASAGATARRLDARDDVRYVYRLASLCHERIASRNVVRISSYVIPSHTPA